MQQQQEQLKQDLQQQVMKGRPSVVVKLPLGDLVATGLSRGNSLFACRGEEGGEKEETNNNNDDGGDMYKEDGDNHN
ncbi:unnamed protein product [Camellia sinensis]